MRFMKFLMLFQQVVRLNKNSQQSTAKNIYRLVEIKQSFGDQYKLVIQVIGKSIMLESCVQEIVTNDRMLEGFSRQDIRTIVYFACLQHKQPRYKIVMQEFCIAFNKMLFKLKKIDSDEIIAKTAAQIALDKHLIRNMSQEDACSISYTAGYEHSLQENKMILTTQEEKYD
jgi:hypothetical protein